MKLKIVAHTKGKKNEALLYQTNKSLDISYVEQNNLPIAVAYNHMIDQSIEDQTDVLILCHDDISIDSHLSEQLPSILKEFDVFGVAGSSSMVLKKPISWKSLGQHAMASGKVKGNCLHGAVAHGTPEYKAMSSYGPYPCQALVIDGVFLGIKRKVFETIRFDESCPSPFDFYDLDYSLQCNMNGFIVGVSDICITHQSGGRYHNSEYPIGEDWFLNKWFSPE